jgi:hypothetical protein
LQMTTITAEHRRQGRTRKENHRTKLVSSVIVPTTLYLPTCYFFLRKIIAFTCLPSCYYSGRGEPGRMFNRPKEMNVSGTRVSPAHP